MNAIKTFFVICFLQSLTACSEPDKQITRSTADGKFLVTLKAEQNWIYPAHSLPIQVRVQSLIGPVKEDVHEEIELVANNGRISPSTLSVSLSGPDVDGNGADQVFIWRRSYDVKPPPLSLDDARHPRHESCYQQTDIPLPASECLKDVFDRVLPFWNEVLVPLLKAEQRLLIVAHGNSLRAMVKHLDQVSDEDIPSLNIPTGIPLVYELDSTLQPISSQYLGDPDAARKAAEAVARQAGGH
mgnify:CR=1 FL=1